MNEALTCRRASPVCSGDWGRLHSFSSNSRITGILRHTVPMQWDYVRLMQVTWTSWSNGRSLWQLRPATHGARSCQIESCAVCHSLNT